MPTPETPFPPDNGFRNQLIRESIGQIRDDIETRHEFPFLTAHAELTGEQRQSMDTIDRHLSVIEPQSWLTHMMRGMNMYSIEGDITKQDTRGQLLETLTARLGEPIIDKKGNVVKRVLTAAQLWAISNYHRQAGYYPQDFGINTAGSAFTTSLEIDKDYRNAYAEITAGAYELNHQSISAEHPFTVVIIGDGNGPILNSILAQQRLDPQCTRIIAIDSSPHLLVRQQRSADRYPQYKPIFISADVQNLSKTLEPYQLDKSISVFLTDELFDVLPGPVIEKNRTGQAVEGIYDIQDQYLLEAQLKLSGVKQVLYKNWLRAFPHYRELFEKLDTSGGRLTTKNNKNPHFSLQVGMLSFISQLKKLKFNGYWIGGDYCSYYHTTPQGISRLPEFLSIRAIPLPGSKSPRQSHMRIARFEYADVSTDVDPGLLAFAKHKGMLVDFAGRPAHFIDSALGKPYRSRKDVESELKNIIVESKVKGLDWASKQLWDLQRRVDPKQFNWIVRSNAQLPPLNSSPGLLTW